MKAPVQCIFHQKAMEAQSIEHIISESFGNKKYIMEKGAVCDDVTAGSPILKGRHFHSPSMPWNARKMRL